MASPTAELWTTGKEIKVPSDLKGLKVRISGELANKAVGDSDASPVNITMAEMYEGIERGVFDSFLLNPASTKDYGMADLIKYGTGAEFGGGSIGLAINEKVYQGLPKNVQEVLIQVGDELTESTAKFYDEYNASVIQQFRDDGVEMYELTDSEQAKWREFYSEIETSWVQEQNNPKFRSYA